jgi:ferredoxin/flavodoxin---NADP+ reductase
MHSHNVSSKTEEGVVDLAIIGAGPTGLFAAFYAGMRQMSVKLIDSLDALGGQLTALYPEKYIYDVAGFPKVLTKDLVRDLVTQAMQYSPTVCLGEQVTTLEEAEAGKLWKLSTNKGTHLARTILIAGGMGSFQHKTLPLQNAPEYVGRGLHYSVKELSGFHGKRVLIVGGGDSAVDWANMIAPLAHELTLIHRRDQFRAHEDSVKKMHGTRARIKTFFELKSIGGSGKIQTAVIFDNRTKTEESLEIDAVLVNIGFSNSLGPIKDWGLTIDKGQIVVDGCMCTNRPGIFGAGDIVSYPGKLKLIATGFGEACTAVCHAKHHIDPKAKVFPGHSSEMK